jgi:hypothetical protein
MSLRGFGADKARIARMKRIEKQDTNDDVLKRFEITLNYTLAI